MYSKKNLVLFLLICLNFYPNISTADVKVYKHCSYKGYAVNLPVGRYKLSDLKALGIKNDDLSSLQVTSGYGVRLYEHDNFKGKSIGILKSDQCLVNNNFNDKISSIVVSRQNFGNKYYQFRAMNNEKCLDVRAGNLSNRANIQLYECHNGANQGWKLKRISGNEYKIISKKSQKCLDVSSRSRSNGANVHQWSCLNINNQRWIVTNKMTSKGIRYQLKAKHSDKCLTNLGNNNRANVVQKNCINRGEPRNQLWRLKNLNYEGS